MKPFASLLLGNVCHRTQEIWLSGAQKQTEKLLFNVMAVVPKSRSSRWVLNDSPFVCSLQIRGQPQEEGNYMSPGNFKTIQHP